PEHIDPLGDGAKAPPSCSLLLVDEDDRPTSPCQSERQLVRSLEQRVLPLHRGREHNRQAETLDLGEPGCRPRRVVEAAPRPQAAEHSPGALMLEEAKRASTKVCKRRPRDHVLRKPGPRRPGGVCQAVAPGGRSGFEAHAETLASPSRLRK